jgi:hypothetical protein
MSWTEMMGSPFSGNGNGGNGNNGVDENSRQIILGIQQIVVALRQQDKALFQRVMRTFSNSYNAEVFMTFYQLQN